MGSLARRVLLWVFVTALLLVASPRRAHALSCSPRTVAQQVNTATAVFLGRVKKNVAVGEVRLVTFAVSRTFKGAAVNTDVSVWSESSKWQWPFAVGDEYVIFAMPFDGATPEQNRLSKLHTFVCMGDMKTDQAPAEVKAQIAEIEAAIRSGAASASASAAASASAPASASASACASAPASAPASASASASASDPAPASAGSPPPTPPPPPSGCGGCATAGPSAPGSSLAGLLVVAVLALRRVSLRRRVGRPGSTY